MKVIIPLQTTSTRVKNKNIRPFFGNKSLFDIKAEQILRFIDSSEVYVSSENEDVSKLCQRYGFNFLLRDVELTGNSVYQPDLIRALIAPIPGDDDVAWIQVTSPLFNEFRQAIEVWSSVRDQYDSLVAVKRFRGHLLDSEGNPINYSFGYWHKVSQKLPAYYQVLWSLFILKRATIKKYEYHIGVAPYLYESSSMTIDIDYEEDFELASLVYKRYIGGGNAS